MFIDHVVVRVWGPEKVFKLYLSRCWEKGCISCHQHVTISSFERFFFSLWKDSSFPAPGWEDSLFPGAGSPSRRRLSSRRRLKPSSFPSAGWKLSSLAGRKTSNRGDILTTVAGLHPHPVAAWLLNIPIRCHRWFVRSPFSYLFPLIITMLFPLDPSVTTYHLLDGTMDCIPMMIDDN